MNNYRPEGWIINTPGNEASLRSLAAIKECITQQKTVEAVATMCDLDHNLIVDLGIIKGIIPHNEGATGIDTGETRDIAIISRVGKPVCFKIIDLVGNKHGQIVAMLSRKKAQQECFENYISKLTPGMVIPAKVTHLENFGCFVDIGCGIPSMIPIDMISVSRISHPKDRFYVGQSIKTVVRYFEDNRVFLSHKELLGTWEENAQLFLAGETVSGIVRSVEDYGVFVELTPNLAGLAESREDVHVGQTATVYIKSIIPGRMKIKLIIVDSFDREVRPEPPCYYINEDSVDSWQYSPSECSKLIETVFS